MNQNVELDEESLLSCNSLSRKTPGQLRKLSTEGLAAWQVGWKPTSAKWLLAEKEWARRAMEESARRQRYANLMGLLSVVVGAALSLAVGYLLK
jgi:hypothetical protein